jgi:hypothetical protein
MRSSHIRFRVLLLAAIAAHSYAGAQSADSSARPEPPDDWWLGFHGGSVWSSHSGVPMWDPLSGEIEADGFGYAVGLDATIRAGVYWYMAAVMDFEAWHATSAQSRDVELAMIEGVVDDTVVRRAEVIVETEIDYATVRQAVLYGVVVLGSMETTHLAFELGPTFSLVVVGNLRRKMRLDPSESGRFANPNGLPVTNDGRTVLLFDSDIPRRVANRLGMLGGLRVWHRFLPAVDAWAALRYDVALTNVDDAGRWRASALLLTVGLQLDM